MNHFHFPINRPIKQRMDYITLPHPDGASWIEAIIEVEQLFTKREDGEIGPAAATVRLATRQMGEKMSSGIEHTFNGKIEESFYRKHLFVPFAEIVTKSAIFWFELEPPESKHETIFHAKLHTFRTLTQEQYEAASKLADTQISAAFESIAAMDISA